MKLKTAIIICAIICVGLIYLLQGCSLKPKMPYDTTEKILLGTAIGGQAFDYATTANGLDNGCVEGNPLMPGDKGGILAVKVGVTAAGIGLANWVDNRSARKFILSVLAVVGLGAGVYNTTVDCQGN